MSEEFDWNKHMKVFTQEVAVKVRSNVTRHDVLMSLLQDDEIAFKLGTGHRAILKVSAKFSRKDLMKIIINDPIMERAKEMQVEKEKLQEITAKTEKLEEGK